MVQKRNKLRIIGGRWRSRQIFFQDIPQLRPTPDRVRETLFNWLAPVIVGSHCLDAFAGSGALGFEALSRGASSVLMIEQSVSAIKMLKENAKILQAENLEIVSGSFPYILSPSVLRKFDIIFLDPPFRQNLIEMAANWLEYNHLLAAHAIIYIEAEAELKNLKLPENWHIIRNKTAGQVSYYLVERM